MTWVQNLALMLASCMTFRELLGFLVSEFLDL